MDTMMVTQRNIKFPRFLQGRNHVVTALYLFLFIILISIPSFLSIPTKSRESGGIVDVSEYRKELHCIVEALVYESFGEPFDGIEAVLSVIVNRKNATGKSFCKVIRKPKQFSFRNDHPVEKDLSLKNFKGHHKYLKIQEIAHNALIGEFKITLPASATHFAGKNVKNSWIRRKKLIKIIGGHAFYN